MRESRRRRTLLPLVAGLVLAGGLPPSATGQAGGVTVLAGPSEYDLSGVGTSWFTAARADVRPVRFLVLEGGLHYFQYRPQLRGDRIRYLIPEAQVQLEPLRGRYRPYVGVGAGGAWMSWAGDDRLELALSGSVGLRVRLNRDWGLLAEGRVRSIDPWTGSMGDLAFGLTRRLWR